MNRTAIAALVAAGLAAAPATAPAQQAQPQAQPAAPRAPTKAPLGRRASEVLGMKVVVSDMARSHEFYTRVVGLKPAKSIAQSEPLPPPGADRSKWPVEYGYNFSGTYGDAFFDTLRPRADNLPTRASADLVVLIFKVPDAPAVMRRASELGYEVIREAPAAKSDEMSIGFIRDPDGYRVEIIQAPNYPEGK